MVTPHRLYTLVLAEQLHVILQAIRRYDEEIAQLAPQHPDYELFSAVGETA